MNVLGLVFSLILILSYTFFACWDKHVGSNRLRKTYIGQEVVHRKILNQYQSAVYKKLPSKKVPTRGEQQQRKGSSKKNIHHVEINPNCSKINLWPLIQEGKDSHTLLYELVAKTLRTFYGPFDKRDKSFEYHFLDALLAACKKVSLEQKAVSLEKIDLHDEVYQQIYYKMLKGTKQWDLFAKSGYPSLLDYVKVDPGKGGICLFHAHPDLIYSLFNKAVALKLFEEMHKEDRPLLTEELVTRICHETHYFSFDPTLFELLELKHSGNEDNKKTFIAHDPQSSVSLRKTLYLKG